ncbi:hypothetical protein SAMN05216534_0026 [Candidatus Aquiluna sp. UB-MaderosW2red]|nr:hypothetical protein SAMN05216534_0026 [Candidatus Aquiluna sp. UB-MaderosW2red]
MIGAEPFLMEVRIPAGWLLQRREVSLEKDENSAEIGITQTKFEDQPGGF